MEEYRGKKGRRQWFISEGRDQWWTIGAREVEVRDVKTEIRDDQNVEQEGEESTYQLLHV